MRILDILNAPWALAEARLQEIREIYYAHTRREKLDLKAWEAASGRPSGAERQPYQVVDGVAIIPIQGVITKANSAWNAFCGMTSSQLLQQDLQAALNDYGVHSILLQIDSPGGMVDGTQELAQAVFAARAQKHIVALADGCMCSAAYWVGAAAEQIYITSDTTEVGSIGVVAAHRDMSAQEAQYGVKTTEITAGKYKRVASQYAPLSEDGRASIQGQVDHIYSVFVEAVAAYRGMSVDTVLADMADGRVFLGQQAVAAGLVDGVSTMTDLIAQLNQDRATWKPGAGVASKRRAKKGGHLATTSDTADGCTCECTDCQNGSCQDCTCDGCDCSGCACDTAKNGPGMASAHSHREKPMKITRELLVAEAPELLTAILAEGEAKGAAAELDRVKGCLDASMPGYEAEATAFALDGKTSPGAAAQSIIASQKNDLKAAKAKTESGVKPVPGGEDPQAVEDAGAAAKRADAAKDGKPVDAKEFAAQITAHVAKAATEGRTLTAAQAAAELAKGKE